MRAAVGALLLCGLAGVASADPKKPPQRVFRFHMGPGIVHAEADDIDTARPGPEESGWGVVAAIVGEQPLSPAVAVHGYGFGMLAQNDLVGAGVGFGPTLHPADGGPFLQPTVWAGWLGGEPQDVARRYDAWFGADARVGWDWATDRHTRVGFGLDAWFGFRPATGEGYRVMNGYGVAFTYAR